MSLLEKLHTGKKFSPPRICLFGAPGVGKSTFAAQAPSAVFIPVENGIDQIDCTSLPHCKTMSEFIGCLNELLTEPHEFKTLVVDSLSALQDIVVDNVLADAKAKFLTAAYGGFNRGNDAALMIIRKEVFPLLERIRTERGMAIIYLAHAHDETVRHPDGSSERRTAPDLIAPIRDYIVRNTDILAYGRIRTMEDASGNRIVIGANGGERELVCEGNSQLLAKNRYGISAEPLPFKWDALFAAIKSGSGANGGS